MALWTKQELIEALADELLEHRLSDDLEIDEVVIDSRKTPKSGIFLAIEGEKNDAHEFLVQASENGCKVMLVHKKSALEKTPKSDFLLVKNTFKALYKLAEFSRRRSSAKIIAITGSVGKTGTKEMLKLAFSAYGKTFATAGNLNNHFGVPLCLSNFSADCKFGIFEMGMNHANEIKPLSCLVRPHLAIITNVGPVHIEFFDDEEGIALAKSEIFLGLEPEGFALINKDNKHFNFIKTCAEIAGVEKGNILTFGVNSYSNYCLEKSEIKGVDSAEVLLKIEKSREISYKISASSKTTIYNSVIIAGALDLLTNDSSIGLAQLAKIADTAGRGKAFEITFSNKKITIIDDSYNASVLSMRAGLEHALELKNALKKKRVVAALGDMLELGEKSLELHEEVTKYLQDSQIDFAILVGEKMSEAAKKLDKNIYKTFSDSALACLAVKDLLQDGDIFYVKGSRGTKMEKLIQELSN